MIFEWLKQLTVFMAGEVSDDDDGGFLDGDDDSDASEDADEDAEEPEDEEPEDDDDDEDEDEDFFSAGDEDDDDEDEDDDEEEEDTESEDDPESEGEGGEEDGGATALARALREATRARLMSMKAQETAPAGIQVQVPTVEDLKKIPELEDLDDEDLRVIHAISSHVVQNAITSYNESAVAPLRTTSFEKARKDRVIANYQDFRKKYPDVSNKSQETMSELWDDFSKEFGRDLADEITFEDLYIMSGGKGKAAAKRKVQGVAKKLATDQKRKASRSTRQAGRLGKVRSGGKRTSKKGDSDAARATKHIRNTQLNPFTMP